ncbi:four helix bundle protein [Opitutaceae bacterium TAV4]|nr:four helix bundle protein [Opitutaceae bacterium TAV4]RRJ98693.1 four helix bundle protein [Opitutaceae bacterium TAV3]
MDQPAQTEDTKRKFDLEERLLDFSARIIRLAEKLPQTETGKHVSKQMLRSGTSPCANHGEAEEAESPDDFIHKLKICLKELRETWRWLRLIERVPLIENPVLLAPLLDETDQLIRIFRKSILTAQKRQKHTA